MKLHAIFYGQVQGVGFRAFCYRYAIREKFSGFTRNVSDGSVELVAFGEKERLEKFLKEIAMHFSGKIERVVSSYEKETFKEKFFNILP